MTRSNLMLAALLLTFATTLSSCEAIAGIFKAGIWTGIILVVVIVGLIVYFIGKAKK